MQDAAPTFPKRSDHRSCGLVSVVALVLFGLLAPVDRADAAQDDAEPAARPAVLSYRPMPRPSGAGVYGFERVEPAGSASAAPDVNAQESSAQNTSAEDAALAALFVRLHFDLERGAPREVAAFWAGPIEVRPDAAMEAYRPFLARFLAVLRNRSAAPVELGSEGGDAVKGPVLHIRAGPGVGMRRELGPATCVAFPGDWRWSDLAAALAADKPPLWSAPGAITAATVFVPDRAPPWLVRACLMEEISQAFGPAGDFFWLTGSIFNDDNVRLSPGAVDYLMIRLSFAPELSSGLSRAETAVAARAALRRIRREDPDTVPTAPRVYADDHDWRARLRLARSIRHPTFSEVYYREAGQAGERLAPDDPRRLWTRFEAARERSRSRPGAAEAELDALSAAFAERDGPGGLYQAMADLERAQVRLAFSRFDEVDSLVAPARVAFLAADREDLVALADRLRAAARQKRRRALDARDLDEAAVAWRDYAYGKAVPVTRLAEARAPARPAQGHGPIALAMVLTIAPVLMLVWLLRRVF